MRMSLLIFVVISGVLLTSGCSNGGMSASHLYSFADTKPVYVQIIIDYKLDETAGLAVTDAVQSFYLNAFMLSDSEVPVAIGRDVNHAELDLPVSLQGTHLSFDAVVQVPAASNPGASGYTFRFNLVEKADGASLLGRLGLADDMVTESVKNLDTLKGGVQPGATAKDNPVNLSLATTLAYKVVKETGKTSDTSAYEKVLDLMKAQVNATEASLDAAKSTDLTTYAGAVIAGLKLRLTTDEDFQTNIAQALASDVSVERTSSDGSSLEVKFTHLLEEFASDVKTALGSNDTPVAKVFKSDAIKVEDIPNPDTYASVIYAPASVSFVDQDSMDSIGGNILVAAPKSQQGIESFNIYLAGAAKPGADKKLLGNILATASPLQLSLDSGFNLTAEQTHFWVFPVAAGTELDIGTSAEIENLMIPVGLSYATVHASYMQNTAISPNTSTSTGATIKSYKVSPSLPAGLTIDSATGVISGTPTSSSPDTEYVVTGTTGTYATSTKITILVRVAPPLGLSYAVQNATYVAGSLVADNIPRSTGGAIASYAISPLLPSGLSLDMATGVISGRPTASSAQATYTVTGTNATGSTTTTIKVAIDPAPPATVTLSPPALIKSGTAFTLSGTCSGELGTISVDIGNDGVSTAGVSSDPLVCTCENGAFSCPGVTIDYGAYSSEVVSYKTTISSAWAGNGSQTSTNSTKILYLNLGGAASIDDNAAFSPSGTCAPNGATVLVTAPAGFSPTSTNCSCASHALSGCGNLTESNAALNTALTVGGTLTYSGQNIAVAKSLTVRNDPPEVMSSQSGAGYAYQTNQLGGLSFTRYGRGIPTDNMVSHLELADFVDDPVGNADGLRDDGSVAERPYMSGFDENPAVITAGWTTSATDPKYADANGEITAVADAHTSGDTYRGYFVPPQNGVYKFVVLTVDNSVRLMMSPNECPKDAVAIVSADWAANVGAVNPASKWIDGNGGSYADSNHYNHDTGVFFPGGRSDPDYADGTTYLVANKIYYFEIRYGEGGGSHYFTFGMDRRNFGSTTWDGVANLKAATMLPYEGTDRYIPRQACGGSSYNAAQLFSDREGNTLTYGAYLVAADGSALPDTESDVSYIGLTFDTAAGTLAGVVNSHYNGQKVVFTAKDPDGSNQTVSSDPVSINP